MVDDDPMCLKVVSAMLSRCNYSGQIWHRRRHLPTPAAWKQPAVMSEPAPASAASACSTQAGAAGCPSRLPAARHQILRRGLVLPVCAVDTKSSGQDALKLLRERHEEGHLQFDLVLSDVYMPGGAAAACACVT